MLSGFCFFIACQSVIGNLNLMEFQGLCIGIDFGGTSVKMGVIKGHEIIDTAPPIATQDFVGPKPLIEAIERSIAFLRSEHPDIAAIGIGIPGFVDFEQGYVHNLTNVEGWREIPLADTLQQLTGLPCIVENDANCMAYAEAKFGSAQGHNHAVCLTLGTGVGGGLIVNGQLLRGARSGAGEIGQTSIDYQGRVGHYGNVGALEDYIGNREIAADARQTYALHGIERSITECSPAILAAAANEGDEVAIKIWNDIAKKLACALVNCCYLLNPSAIVIGGGIAKAGDTLFEPLKRELFAQVKLAFAENLVISQARFGNEAGMIGAAALASEFIV